MEFSAPQLRDTAEPFVSAVRANLTFAGGWRASIIITGPGIVSEHLMPQGPRPSRRLQNYCFQEE